MSNINIEEILDSAYEEYISILGDDVTYLNFVGEWVFDFTTYDSGEGSALETLTLKALEVAKAISDGKTFEYQQQSGENYLWYMIIVNMPFFKGKIDWGCSIRGAWWDYSNIALELGVGEEMIVDREDMVTLTNILLSKSGVKDEEE